MRNIHRITKKRRHHLFDIIPSIGNIQFKRIKNKRDEMVCTKTLYNYVSLGLLPIKNIDLPEKLKRHTSNKHSTDIKRKLGKSIEERPESVELRNEFGRSARRQLFSHTGNRY